MRAWVDSSSVASIAEACPQYGERRRVLMHAWLDSVHWDATRKVCVKSVQVGKSESEVRGDQATVNL